MLKLSKQECDKLNEEFMELQKIHLKDNSNAEVWTKLYKTMEGFFTNYIKKLSKFNYVIDLEDKVGDAILYMFERWRKKKQLVSLTAYGHWVSMMVLYKKQTVFEEQALSSDYYEDCYRRKNENK